MFNFFAGIATGFLAAIIWIRHADKWFHQAASIVGLVGFGAVLSLLALAAYLSFRDKDDIERKRKAFEQVKLKADREREEWTRQHIQRVKEECAREKQSLVIERDNLVSKNRRLTDALRSKWGEHVNNVERNNPGRANRMRKKSSRYLEENGI